MVIPGESVNVVSRLKQKTISPNVCFTVHCINIECKNSSYIIIYMFIFEKENLTMLYTAANWALHFI